MKQDLRPQGRIQPARCTSMPFFRPSSSEGTCSKKKQSNYSEKLPTLKQVCDGQLWFLCIPADSACLNFLITLFFFLGFPTDAGFLTMVSEINSRISAMGFQIRRAKWPPSGNSPPPQLYVGFVNTEADDSSKKASRYCTKDGKPDARYAAFFRALLDKIAAHPGDVNTGLGSVSLCDALNCKLTIPDASSQGQSQGQSQVQLQKDLATFRASDRQAALNQFVTDGWLSFDPSRESEGQGYCLGPRSFLELPRVLEDMEMQPLAKQAFEAAIFS
jgi:hypothetical protein